MNHPIPSRMQELPIDPDRRQFRVPYFVAWIDGKADYRVADPKKLVKAVRENLCWLCGQRLESTKTFVIGPMCAVNRTSAEPPCHRDCAEYAVKVCPFLAHPKMVRNTKDLPEIGAMPGHGLLRNPGISLVWETNRSQPFRAYAGGEGLLFRIGDPIDVSFWCEARPATRDEILSSLDTGLMSLLEAAMADPLPGAIDELNRRYEAVLALLPAV